MRLKKCAERAQAFKPDVEADVGDAPVSFRKEKLGVLQPSFCDKLMRRFAVNPFEKPQQVMRRQLGGLGNPGKADRL